MKIYGNRFTMIDSNEYDLIQMINEIDMERIEKRNEQKEQFTRILNTLIVGVGLLAAQIVIGSLIASGKEKSKS